MSEGKVQSRKRIIRRQYHLKDNIGESTSDCSPNRAPTANLRKKIEGLICSICEGPAHGYNFDTITCESCKAFFRRNALRTDRKFKCRANHGHCIITVATRKRCKACRLAKCFAQGMRSDWILTDEERMNKRRKIEENRRLRKMLYPESSGSNSDEDLETQLKLEPLEPEPKPVVFFHIPVPLPPEDLKKIEQIQQAYASSVRLTSLPPGVPSYPNRAEINEPWDMMNLPTNLQTTRLITFFKLIPEISALNEHDKLILVKYNSFQLCFIRSVLVYDPITDVYHEPGTDDCVFAGKDLIQCFSLHQYEQSTRCVCQLLNASQSDRSIVQILLIISLLSKGSAPCTYTNEREPIAQDILSVYRLQNHFIELLWRYCESKYGHRRTVDMTVKLVMGTMNACLQAYNTRYRYVKNDVVADQLVPLMKSVMLNV